MDRIVIGVNEIVQDTGVFGILIVTLPFKDASSTSRRFIE